MRTSFSTFGAIVVACIAGQAATAQSVQRVGSNGVYSATRNFGSGVYDDQAGANGKTFVTWSGANMDVYARAYDHASDTWEAPLLVRDNNCGSSNCYHNYPVMVKAPNGKSLIFFFNHDSEGYLLTPPNVNSLNGTWTRSTILSAASGERPGYPTAVVAGNSIYLFYRSKVADIYRPLKFIKSSNNGASWSAPKTVIDTGNAQADGLNEIYAFDIGYESAVAGRPARIRLTWALHGGASHNQKSKNVYFAYLHTADDSMRTVNGSNLGASIDSSDFSNQDQSRLRAVTNLPTGSILQANDNKMPARPDANGHPTVGYNKRVGSGGSDLEPYTVRWTGSDWVQSRVAIGGVPVVGRIMDFQYISDGNMRAILTVNDRTVRALQTNNGGTGWSAVWSLDASSQLVNGADAITYLNVIERPGYKVQAIGGTTSRAQLDSDYSGKWAVFAIKD